MSQVIVVPLQGHHPHVPERRLYRFDMYVRMQKEAEMLENGPTTEEHFFDIQLPSNLLGRQQPETKKGESRRLCSAILGNAKYFSSACTYFPRFG